MNNKKKEEEFYMTDEHKHDESCDCGCEEMMDVLVLVDEEEQEHEFELIGELEVDGSNYKVLIPLDEEIEADEDEEEVVILKAVLDENGEELLSDIEDDEEWEKVADAWDEALASGQFDD